MKWCLSVWLCSYFSPHLSFLPLSLSFFLTGPALNTSPLLSILCYYLTELNPPTCSPVLTMDNMSVRVWQIKPARYMAITFTAKHGMVGEGCYKGRRTETERGIETHTDGWGHILSRACYFQPQLNVCTLHFVKMTHLLLKTLNYLSQIKC